MSQCGNYVAVAFWIRCERTRFVSMQDFIKGGEGGDEYRRLGLWMEPEAVGGKKGSGGEGLSCRGQSPQLTGVWELRNVFLFFLYFFEK